jgi:tetratricopeptide (TPR) repeat protein
MPMIKKSCCKKIEHSTFYIPTHGHIYMIGKKDTHTIKVFMSTSVNYTQIVDQIIRSFDRALEHDYIYQGFVDVMALCDLVPDDIDQSVISQLYKGKSYDKMQDSLGAEICYRKALNLHQKFNTEVSSHWEPRIRDSLRRNLMKQGKVDVLINEFKLSPSVLLVDAVNKKNYPAIQRLMDLGANPFENGAFASALETFSNGMGRIAIGDNRIGLYFLSYLTDKKYNLPSSFSSCSYGFGEWKENETQILGYIDKICSRKLVLSIDLTKNQIDCIVQQILGLYREMDPDQWGGYDELISECGYDDYEESERSRHTCQLEDIEALRQKEEIKHRIAMRQISNIRFFESLDKSSHDIND